MCVIVGGFRWSVSWRQSAAVVGRSVSRLIVECSFGCGRPTGDEVELGDVHDVDMLCASELVHILAYFANRFWILCEIVEGEDEQAWELHLSSTGEVILPMYNLCVPYVISCPGADRSVYS